jgi:hypothetical protein
MTTPDDLAVFYDLDEFALSATRARSGVASVTFAAIPGVVDNEALEGHVMAARRRLAFVTGPDAGAGTGGGQGEFVEVVEDGEIVGRGHGWARAVWVRPSP